MAKNAVFFLETFYKKIGVSFRAQPDTSFCTEVAFHYLTAVVNGNPVKRAGSFSKQLNWKEAGILKKGIKT